MNIVNIVNENVLDPNEPDFRDEKRDAEEVRRKRKTLSDVVREMRTRSREVKEAFGGRPDGVENMLDIWADCIEAIAKREMTEAEANALVVGGIVEAARHKPGNAAAMREALREAIGETCAGCKRDCDDCMNLKSGWMKKAKAALSAPARNCDLYATYAEAAEAHKEYATAYIMRASNKFDFPMEFDEWLFAQAAERKGERRRRWKVIR